jgi:hypothetical protein
MKGPAFEGLEGDQIALRRPIGARRFEHRIGEPFSGAADRGNRPQRLLQIEVL